MLLYISVYVSEMYETELKVANEQIFSLKTWCTIRASFSVILKDDGTISHNKW